MSLNNAKPGHTARIHAIRGSEKLRNFLFTLGCSEGEKITLVSVLAGNYIISVGDSRYAIDRNTAKAIEVF